MPEGIGDMVVRSLWCVAAEVFHSTGRIRSFQNEFNGLDQRENANTAVLCGRPQGVTMPILVR